MYKADNFLGKPIIPGDVFVARSSTDISSPVVVGPGLEYLNCANVADQEAESREIMFRVQAAGVLNHAVEDDHLFYVNSAANYQYQPSVDDHVVGLVVGKTIDYYRVFIRSRELAFLGQLAFEGATKRNRPDVNIGDVVFARVSSVAPGVSGRQAELICFNPDTDKAEGMGVLRDPNIVSAASGHGGSQGLVFALTNSQQISRLVSKSNKLIKELGKRIPFEAAYGSNGINWVRARSVRESILVANLIQALSTFTTNDKERANQLIDAALNRLAEAS